MFEIEIDGVVIKGIFGMHVAEKMTTCDIERIQDREYFLSRLIFFGNENYCKGRDMISTVDPGAVYESLIKNWNSQSLLESIKKMLDIYDESQARKAVDQANENLSKKKAELMTLQKLGDTPLESSD